MLRLMRSMQSLTLTSQSQAQYRASVGDESAKAVPFKETEVKFPEAVIRAAGPNASPRACKVLSNLIRHLHEFVEENKVTFEELLEGIDFINSLGRASNEKHNEGQLVCDILGLESHIIDLDYQKSILSVANSTPPAVMGPFWRQGAPIHRMGETIVFGIQKGNRTLVLGRVLDCRTGSPIQEAIIDTWQAAPNGKYESNDAEQLDMNLRGRFVTKADGKYWYYTVRPAGYLVPHDGPAGKLLKLLDRQPRRPGHIHYIITAPGYKPLVTQLFDSNDRDLDNDVAFAVKRSLVIDFVPLAYDRRAEFEVRYDFRLVREDDKTEDMRAPSSYDGFEEHRMPGSWRNA